MFCSTVLPTIGRSTLARAAQSVLAQGLGHDDFEIIVVNDSGDPLQEEDWQKSNRVKIIHTQCHERSVARNVGAACAKGKYLHFLDDDDWLLPDAFQAFWDLHLSTSPAWMYGGSQLVDRKGNSLIQLHHGLTGNCFLQAMAGEWIPLQSSLINADLFHKLGGFNPLITGPEDIDLLRRITLHGEVSEIRQVVACIEMGNLGSTTNYSHHSELSRWAREKILDLPGGFKRMRTGATSDFWRGKFTRIYFTSALWNLQHKRTFTFLSRFFHATWSMKSAGRSIFSRAYWSSLSKPYQSTTFAAGIRESQLEKAGQG